MPVTPNPLVVTSGCTSVHPSRAACFCCCAEFKLNPGATLHLWTTDADAWTTLTAHSNPDGTYR